MRKVLATLKGDERVRFLIVGGVNTLLGYGLFALLDLTVGRSIGYLGCLFIAYSIATVVAFVLHRRFTFKVDGTGSAVVDFLRFSVVYLITLALNSIALPLLVEVGHIPPLIAQAAITVAATILSYFGHKFFSFRRPSAAAGADTDLVANRSNEQRAD
jgi:putative flippase GtrA